MIEHPPVIEAAHQLAQPAQQLVDRFETPVGPVQDPLIGLGSHQPEPVRRLRPARDFDRLVDAPTAGSAPTGAQLDQHVDGPPFAPTAEGPLHRLHRLDRIDQGQNLRRGVGGQLVEGPADRGRIDEVVGDQHPLHPEGPHHPGLAGGGGGDGPRPGVDLAGDDLR